MRAIFIVRTIRPASRGSLLESWIEARRLAELDGCTILES